MADKEHSDQKKRKSNYPKRQQQTEQIPSTAEHIVQTGLERLEYNETTALEIKQQPEEPNSESPMKRKSFLVKKGNSVDPLIRNISLTPITAPFNKTNKQYCSNSNIPIRHKKHKSVVLINSKTSNQFSNNIPNFQVLTSNNQNILIPKKNLFKMSSKMEGIEAHSKLKKSGYRENSKSLYNFNDLELKKVTAIDNSYNQTNQDTVTKKHKTNRGIMINAFNFNCKIKTNTHENANYENVNENTPI